MNITSKASVALFTSLGLLVAFARPAFAEGYLTNFESFTLGNVDGQDGWTSGHAACAYDEAVVSNTYGLATFGAQSLRISNAVTCGSYNDQTLSKSLADDAGESTAPASVYSGGTRQPYFEAQWDFASTVPGSEQVGLSTVANASRGDTMRVTWLQMQDTPSGLQLNFQDYQRSVTNFVTTPIATGLSRTVPHRVKMTIKFLEGASNDVVNVYLDGTLIHTGTTWEDYYRDFAGGLPFSVDSVMFRVAGTAAPALAGNGFLIDNFSSLTGQVPGTLHVIKHVINDNTGTTAASGFTVHVQQGGVEATNSPAPGQESPGSVYSLQPVTYSISEDPSAGYVRIFSGDCDTGGNVTVASETDKTCTITNDDIRPASGGGGSTTYTGTIEVIKVVVNDDGGTKAVSDFPLFINGSSVISGETNTFQANTGMYTVSETDDVGYARSFAGDCDADGNITLHAAEHLFCTITNNDIAPGVPPSPTGTDEQLGITRDGEGRRTAPRTSNTGPSPITGLQEPISEIHPGQFIRSYGFSTVYLVTDTFARRPFWDTTTYFTWAQTFDEVVWVTDATLPTLPVASPMLPKAGVVLVKLQSDPKTYEVELAQDGAYRLRWLTSEEVARARYGTVWADFVIDLEPTILSHYERGADQSSLNPVDKSMMKTRAKLAELANNP